MVADWSQLPKELLHHISERLDNLLYHLRFRSVCSWWRSSSSPLSPRKIMVADWSKLPKELLHQISERLGSPLYRLRFRSVCSWWRSSASPLISFHEFPSTFPTVPDAEGEAYTFFLSKCSLLLITPPPHQPIRTPILVQAGQDLHGRTLLYNPLSCCRSFPLYFSSMLDLYHLPIIDLGNAFVLHNFPPAPPSRHHDSIYGHKVVVAPSGLYQGKQEPSILLTIHSTMKRPAHLRCSSEYWIRSSMPPPYDDVCVYNGQPCAVDCNGWTVVTTAVRLGTYKMELVAKPGVFGGDRKILVESEGSLLLVDMHLSNEDYRWERFNVFRLDKKEKKWVEVTSLGDRVVFLGDACAFSASASDLCVGKGNCVIFKDSTLKGRAGVFPLDVGRISPLSDHPEYSRLFDYNRLFNCNKYIGHVLNFVQNFKMPSCTSYDIPGL
ncbi:F-box protein SKIP23-like [Lotus japonicus]|uniref:F-box protein SKIP23-like n=1 Tax=Lotus japonicus TaxID=34305 RepID=UPI00258E3C4B|nr:F-box protein SKIP23-like [Lotus japonicus]